MDITDRQTVARTLAKTYSDGHTPNPWGRVTEYQRVLDYTAKHPEKGSSAVASALELPRGRVRTWMDGGRPDAVHAIQTAADHDWLNLNYGEPPFTGLNILVAWTFAAGAIAEDSYVPTFHVTSESRACLETALDHAHVGDYRAEHADDDNRATELRPTTNQTTLGRLLVALGAPLGTKNTEADIQLPLYLADAPTATRVAFARTYVWNRATENLRESLPVQITEARSETYHRELAAFLTTLSDGEIRGTTWPLYLTPDAADHLNRPPDCCVAETGSE